MQASAVFSYCATSGSSLEVSCTMCTYRAAGVMSRMKIYLLPRHAHCSCSCCCKHLCWTDPACKPPALQPPLMLDIHLGQVILVDAAESGVSHRLQAVAILLSLQAERGREEWHVWGCRPMQQALGVWEPPCPMCRACPFNTRGTQPTHILHGRGPLITHFPAPAGGVNRNAAGAQRRGRSRVVGSCSVHTGLQNV